MTENDRGINIISANIAEFRRRIRICNEQKSISVHMLAEYICANAKGRQPGSLYADFVKLASERPGFTDVTAEDKVEFCRVLCNTPHFRFASGVRYLIESSAKESVPENAIGRIAYVRNRYNDEAFLKFSSVITRSRAAYSSTFEEACDNVFNGLCEFCILPIENTVSGKLFSFYSLIDRYDLKIVCSCDIDTADKKSGSVRYALIRKNLCDLKSAGNLRYFEFSMANDESVSLSDILAAGKLCSVRLYKTDTIPLPYNDLVFRFYHTFVIGPQAEEDPFIMYLSLEYPQFEPIGLYSDLQV